MSENKKLNDVILWGEHQFSLEEKVFFKIGPLKLWIKRNKNDWVVQYLHQQGDDNDAGVNIERPFKHDLPSVSEYFRFGGKEFNDTLTFSPVFPDRPVVIRPERPFYITKEDSVEMFVMCPLHLKISLAAGKVLTTIPIVPLSDTWFGVDPTQGKLCYSGRTRGRLNFEDLNIFPFRSITKLQFVNRSDENILLERIKLETQYLNLYMDKKRIFFTDDLKVYQGKDSKKFNLSFEKPSQVDQSELKTILSPRKELRRNIFTQAMHHMIG